ncbi:MAG: flagellar basal body rod protein FlgC [Alphaproteobacteria bacterium]|nr:flagellar basal body rod protein FlgC [Alphaproteobacteria bacterium]TAD88850.1 MAG: flagellar basal body rod protein FlgC [Alphaproteobacteria bacterium]
MSSDLRTAMQVAASGMKAQGARIKVISENLANADSTSQTPGGEPYRRKTVTFKNALDRELQAQTVRVDRIRPDQSDFELRFEPGHPAANQDGYVLTPNVNSLIEATDMREAQRSYEANLTVIETSRSMAQRTLDILRG